MRTTRPRRAIALILTLLVLAVLVVIVAQLAYTTSLDHRSAANHAADLANEVALRSAANLVIARLDVTAKINNDGGSSSGDGSSGSEGSSEGEPPIGPGGEPGAGSEPGTGEGEGQAEKVYHTLLDPWAKKIDEGLGETKLSIAVVDEERKWDLSRLVQGSEDDTAKRDAARAELETLLGLVLPQESGVVPADLARDIQDWMLKKGGQPADTTVTPILDSKIPILAIEELQFVKGVTDEILYGKTELDRKVPGLIEFLTVHSNGKINMNTAPKEVIQAILPKGVEDPAKLAQDIVSARGGGEGSSTLGPKTSGSGKPTGEGEGDGGGSASGKGQPFKSLDDVKQVPGMEKDVQATDSGGGEKKTSGEGTEEEKKEEGQPGEGGETKTTVFDALKPRITVTSTNFGVTAVATTDGLAKRAYFVLERGKKRSRIVYWKVANQ